MAFKDLSRAEIDRLLDLERIVRIAFDAGGERFLVPLGFVRHDDGLYAMTTRGRKTAMAAANPTVSFQIDTSANTGPYTWHSVSGEGTFEVVGDGGEIAAVSPLLERKFADMPAWMREEYARKQEKDEVVLVRLRPSRMEGRKSEPG